MESQSTRNFFAEYLIAQAIEVANDVKGPIKYSTGRLIRNDIMRQCIQFTERGIQSRRFAGSGRGRRARLRSCPGASHRRSAPAGRC